MASSCDKRGEAEDHLQQLYHHQQGQPVGTPPVTYQDQGGGMGKAWLFCPAHGGGLSERCYESLHIIDLHSYYSGLIICMSEE